MKKNYFFKKIMLLMILSISVTTLSQELKDVRFKTQLNLKNISLTDGVTLLSKSTGVNILTSLDIQSINLNMYINRGSSLKQILSIIERKNNLVDVKLDNSILLIKKSKDLSNIIGHISDNNRNNLEGVKINLLNSDYSSISTIKDGVYIFSNINPGVYVVKIEKEGFKSKSEIVRVEKGDTTIKDIFLESMDKNNLQVDKKSNISTSNFGTIKKDDTPKNTEISRVKLKYTKTEKMVKILTDLFPGDQLKITEYPSDQILILNGSSDTVHAAEKMLNDVDRPIRQVRITAQVLETSNNLLENLGFNWLFSNRASTIAANAGKKTVQGSLLQPNAANPGHSLLEFTNVFNSGKHLLDVSLDLLQTTNDISISSVPSVVVINGEEAGFQVVDEIEVGTKVTVDTNNVRTEEPIFKEAGTIFKVTPVIKRVKNGKDVISLKIDSEVSNFKSQPLLTTAMSSKSQENIKTNIQLEDGATIFIGGLKRKKVEKEVRKVPILGSIPYLGVLFRHTNTTNEVKQVYIEIKAEIISNDDKAKKINFEGFKSSPATSSEMKSLYPSLGKKIVSDDTL